MQIIQPRNKRVPTIKGVGNSFEPVNTSPRNRPWGVNNNRSNSNPKNKSSDGITGGPVSGSSAGGSFIPNGNNKKKQIRNFDNRRQRKVDPYNPVYVDQNGSGSNNNNGSGSGNNNNNNNKNGNKPGGPNMPVYRGRGKSNGNGNGSNNLTWGSSTPYESSGSASWFSVNRGQNGMSFASPVKSGLIYNDAQDAVSNKWSPLYIHGGKLLPEIDVASGQNLANYLYSVLINDVYFEYLRLAQLNINRVIEPQYTRQKWYNYIHQISKAIQVYYMYDRVQAYISDPGNHNIAIRHLHEEISPSGWNAFSNLKLLISKHYLHPNLIKFLAYMYQNFTPCTSDAGTIFQLAYDNTMNSSSPDYVRFLDGTYAEDIIFQLNSSDNTEVMSYMSRSTPNWRITNLPASSIKPIYDQNFLTFWSNCSVAYVDPVSVTTEFSKVVTQNDTNYSYWIYDNDVDGLFLSCNTLMRDIGPSYTTQPGIWVPTTNWSGIGNNDDMCSFVKFYKVGISKQFIPLRDPDEVAATGLSDAIVLSNGLVTVDCAPLGTKKVITNSIDNMIQASNESIRYLLYPNSES